jgi:3-hydroxyisobutyrate dehydrogenase
MGTLMAGRVRSAGHDLIVWNRTAERTQPLVAEGARAARTPAEAAREAEIVITMLAGPAALEAVTAGPDGIAGAIAPAACLVEMSTVGPKAALAARLTRWRWAPPLRCAPARRACPAGC